MQDRGHLLTELANRRSEHLDTMSVAEAFEVMNAEDASVASAVAAEKKRHSKVLERPRPQAIRNAPMRGEVFQPFR